ncbi:uncharacterized protein VP01_451g1 [Puccinia sorghi]|uniref:Uncharacterized protein n=1 Tax=Puccinia sorghi TaxID=27349 RepID=A0A0L6UP05_9BASI|nr:uncharacterized protein VP01_451g1 [Puccinia sorghi]
MSNTEAGLGDYYIRKMDFISTQQNSLSQPITRRCTATITNNRRQHQPQLQQLDLLQLIDPAVNAASTLTHIRNSLFVPPMVNFATPTIRLEEEEEEEEEPIDNHPICPSNHTQSSRRQQIKRLAQGIRAFIITPIGIIITIYAILVVFWGAALVLILLGWIKIKPKEKYRIWIEICSQVLNGLFTIPGIGLFPSRIIDSWSQQIFFSFFFFGQIIGKLTRITSDITIILYYARVISKRQGRKNLEDPNDLIPLQQSKEDLNKPKEAPVEGQKPVQEGEEQANHNNNDDIHQEEVTQALETDNLEGSCGLIDVWKDDQEIVLYEKEINRLRTAQEKLCHSQTWYRPHSSATHYAFPISWALVIMLLNLGNSLFQAALCAVMWGLRYDTRPAELTNGVLYPVDYCHLHGLFVFLWDYQVKIPKLDYNIIHDSVCERDCTKKVICEASNVLRPTRKDKLRRKRVEGSFEVVNRIKQRTRPAVHHQHYQPPRPHHQRKRSSLVTYPF